MPYTKNRILATYTGWSQPVTHYIRAWSPISGWIVTPYSSTASGASSPNWRYRYQRWNTQSGYKTFLRTYGYLPTLEYSVRRQSQACGSPTSVTWTRKSGNPLEFIEVRSCYPELRMPSWQGGAAWGSSTERQLVATEAQNDCLSRARDMRVNLPVMFAEGRKTVRMLTDTATTLYRAYRAFRRGRPSKAAEILGIDKPTGTAANHWLAYQYGWRPLLSDAKGLAVMAAQLLEAPRAKLIRVSGRAVLRKTISYNASVGGYTVCGVLQKTRGLVEIRGYAGLVLELQSRASAVAAQTGMGVTDPLLVAWELTPFSFVFDWFIDVGQYLENISALQGWTVKAGYTAWEETTPEPLECTLVPNDSTYTIVGGNLPSAKLSETEYYRYSWMGNLPKLVVRSFGDIWNSRRLGTAAALFRQRTMGDRFGSYRP